MGVKGFGAVGGRRNALRFSALHEVMTTGLWLGMSQAQLRSPPISRAGWVGYLYAGLVVLLWSGFSLAGRYAALAPGVRLTPWDLAALRYAVALPIAVAMYVAGPGRGLPWRRGLVVAVVAGLCFPLPAYVGFSYAPAAHAAVILSGTMPFFVAIGLALLGAEQWTRARLLSLVVLLFGIGLLGDAAYIQGARPGAWRGDLLFFVSVIAWSALTIIIRRWAVTPWQVVSTVGIWAGLAYLPVWAVALPSHIAQVPIGVSLFQALMQGLMVTVVSVVLYTRALLLLGAERVSLVTALTPGVAGALSVPLLGEEVGVLDVAGLVLVCVAVVLGVRRGRG